MNILDLIRYQRVSFNLPASIGKLFNYYSIEQKMIEPNQFIVNSLNSFIKNSVKSINEGNIREVLHCKQISFTFDIPRILLFKLLLLSFRVHISLSSILYEALGHSLPLLIETEQIQEDYSYEQQEKEKTNIRE